MKTAEPFSTEEKRAAFASGFGSIRNRAIGRTTIQQVWLVHYARRTLRLILGKVPFILGAPNTLTAEQLLEKLGI